MKNSQWGLTVLRLVLGAVFIYHGWQKLFVFGVHGTAGFFGQVHIPLPLVAAVVVMLVEFLGGIALVLGLFTRWAGILLALDMAGAIYFVHFRNGFEVGKGGYEFALTALAAAVALACSGPGAAALGGMVGRK